MPHHQNSRSGAAGSKSIAMPIHPPSMPLPSLCCGGDVRRLLSCSPAHPAGNCNLTTAPPSRHTQHTHTHTHTHARTHARTQTRKPAPALRGNPCTAHVLCATFQPYGVSKAKRSKAATYPLLYWGHTTRECGCVAMQCGGARKDLHCPLAPLTVWQ